MFYCHFCCIPLGVPDGIIVPRLELPFRRCDVIFDDAPKKATSMHAKVLAPSQVRLIDLFTNESSSNRTHSRRPGQSPQSDHLDDGNEALLRSPSAPLREIPEYDPEHSVVLFPDEGSKTLDEAINASGISLSSLVVIVIDAPWKKAQALRRHPRLTGLQSVRLKSPPPSRFWRYHSEGPGCLSTVEALGALTKEARERSETETDFSDWLAEPLLFFFVRQFAQIAMKKGKEGGELPSDEAAKERRSQWNRQREKVKRSKLKPLPLSTEATENVST